MTKITTSEWCDKFVTAAIRAAWLEIYMSSGGEDNVIEYLVQCQALETVEEDQAYKLLLYTTKTAHQDTRGRIHIIHDCQKNRGSCHCTFIWTESPVRFSKVTVWRHEWTPDVVTGELIYLSTSGQMLTHLFIKDARKAIPDSSMLLAYGGFDRSSQSREVASYVCSSQSPLGQQVRSSSDNSRVVQKPVDEVVETDGQAWEKR